MKKSPYIKIAGYKYISAKEDGTLVEFSYHLDESSKDHSNPKRIGRIRVFATDLLLPNWGYEKRKEYDDLTKKLLLLSIDSIKRKYKNGDLKNNEILKLSHSKYGNFNFEINHIDKVINYEQTLDLEIIF